MVGVENYWVTATTYASMHENHVGVHTIRVRIGMVWVRNLVLFLFTVQTYSSLLLNYRTSLRKILPVELHPSQW